MLDRIFQVSGVILTVMSITATALAAPRRVALVTGANKGIGFEISRKLGLEDGIVCIMGCRDESLGKSAADALTKEGCNVDFVRLDLDDESTIDAAKEFLEERYGGLDILINNAAICFNDPTLYGKVPHTPFEKQANITIRTNFFGTLRVTQTMMPLLQTSPSPRLVFIASSAGRLSILPSEERRTAFSSSQLNLVDLEGYMNEFVTDAADGTHQTNGWPNTGYGVSKVGLIALTRIMARDYPKIMVNSVDPGYCATDQNNNQGFIPAERGATTPFLLATLPNEEFYSGMHWFQEQAIEW